MNGPILCIGGDLERWANWRHELEENGYVVVRATDEREAQPCSRRAQSTSYASIRRSLTESGGLEVSMDRKNASQHVPVVLVQTGNDVAEHFEEHVDVVIDESMFSSVGHWLIEELRETRLPMFAEWFEAWKERSGSNEKTESTFAEQLSKYP